MIMMQPQIAIISENTLSSMALRGLLSEMVPSVDVVSYNSMAVRQIRRVVRAGRRSTIGNRVTGYNLFEGSNPLLSAKK